jgi:hypothetical protein
MPELPDPEQVAALIALIAFGLVARIAFFSRVQRRKEEAGQSVLWAVIWSAPLKLLFDLVGKPPSLFGFFDGKPYDALVAWCFVFNVGFSWLIGYVLGCVYVARIRYERYVNKEKKPKVEQKKVWKKILSELFLSDSPRVDLIQEWLQEKAIKGRWVVVESKDGQHYMGWVHYYDLCQERAKDMHIVLGKPHKMDTATGDIQGSLGEEILISVSDIRLIRLLEPVP